MVPRPGLLLTSNRPPCNSIIAFASGRPSLVPSCFRVGMLSAWPNGVSATFTLIGGRTDAGVHDRDAEAPASAAFGHHLVAEPPSSRELDGVRHHVDEHLADHSFDADETRTGSGQERAADRHRGARQAARPCVQRLRWPGLSRTRLAPERWHDRPRSSPDRECR